MKQHNVKYLPTLALLIVVLALSACRQNDLGQDIPALPSAENNIQTILPLVQDGADSAENNAQEAYPVLADPDTLDTSAGDPQPAENPGSGSAETQPAAEQPAEQAPVVEQPTEVPAPTVPTGPTTHIVQQFETVGSIAEQYGVTIDDILAANDLFNINLISIGQELVIDPGAATRGAEQQPVDDGTAAVEQPAQGFDPDNYFIHTVGAQDTLFNIALRYGFSVEEIAAYNNIVDINRIDLNQQIRIPNR